MRLLQLLTLLVVSLGLLLWSYVLVGALRAIRSVKRIKDLPDPLLAR